MSQKPPKIIQNNIKPPLTFNVTREKLTSELGNSKRRVSQRRGEMADALSDQITQEFTGINMVFMQLYDYIEQLKTRIMELEGTQSPPTSKE